MKKISLFLLPCCMLFFTCFGQAAKPGAPVEKPSEILSSNTSFLNYIAVNLSLLSENYIAYDDHSKAISKTLFLHELTTGNYIFIRLASNNARLYLKLFRFNSAQKKSYGDLVYAYTRFYDENYKKVGKKFPAFDFTDINGKRYTSQNTKGKIIVLKCWFIGCQACQQEMPELNRLVSSYKNRKDILFISIAPDNNTRLRAFFHKTPFNYIKVGNQNNFINQALKVEEFPTHYIINKQGVIVNVVGSPQEIDYSLKNDI